MRIYRIPAPPSVNNLFVNTWGRGRRRAISPKYRDWKAEAARMLQAQKPALVPGRVVVLLSVPPGSLNADIDNCNKAALDLLVAEKVIEGDSRKHVSAVLTSWGVPGDEVAYITAVPAREMTVRFLPSDDGAGGGWFIDGAPLGEFYDGVEAG